MGGKVGKGALIEANFICKLNMNRTTKLQQESRQNLMNALSPRGKRETGLRDRNEELREVTDTI